MTTPTVPADNPVADLTADTDTPPWLNNLVKFLLIAVPVALSVWRPNGSFSSTSAQAAIVAAGVLAAAGLHLAELVAKNGLKKAGLVKTVSEYEAWIKANWVDLQQTFAGAKEAVAAAPNLGDHLSALDAAVADVKAKVDAVPAAQRDAAKQALQELFASGQSGNTNPAGQGVQAQVPPADGEQPPNPAPQA